MPPWFFPSTHKICTFYQKFSTSTQPVKCTRFAIGIFHFQNAALISVCPKPDATWQSKDYTPASSSTIWLLQPVICSAPFLKATAFYTKFPLFLCFIFTLNISFIILQKISNCNKFSTLQCLENSWFHWLHSLSEKGKWVLLSQEFQIWVYKQM